MKVLIEKIFSAVFLFFFVIKALDPDLLEMLTPDQDSMNPGPHIA
jgi:hypothetical protein